MEYWLLQYMRKKLDLEITFFSAMKFSNGLNKHNLYSDKYGNHYRWKKSYARTFD